MNKSSTSTVGLALLPKTRTRIRATVAAVLFLAALLLSSAAAGPFIYVANTGEDTVSKIDVSSNTEVARYAAWFTSGSLANHVPARSYPLTSAGPAPSRIARDSAGNAYVLDRMFAAHYPVLFKIAPAGSGPTSNGSGLGAVLPLLDNNPQNNDIDPAEITDKSILWAKPIGNPANPNVIPPDPGDLNALGRALCMDTTGNLWVGMYNTKRYYKVNPATGAMVGGPVDTPGHTPYGCQVDVNGKLWSVNFGTDLAEIDTITGKFVKLHDHSANGRNYSLSIFNDCKVTPPKVTVYLSNVSGTYIAYDPQADKFTNPPPPSGPAFVSYSVGVDSKGNIISGHLNGRVVKSNPAGTNIWDTDAAGPTQATGNLHGIIVDDNDDIWVVHLPENRVVKYSGAAGKFIAPAVPVGVMPYTYGNTPPATCTGASGDGSTPACAPVADKEIRCEPNGDYSYTFTVTNNSGSDMSQILLTPVPGSTFALSQELFNLPAPLHNGESTTLTVGIGPGKPGEKICFFLSLMSDKAACCMVQVCPKLPKCPDSTYASPTPRPSPTVKKRR